MAMLQVDVCAKLIRMKKEVTDQVTETHQKVSG